MNKNSVNEKQLIGKLQELRQIKPSKNWASFTKKEILGDEPGFTFSPYLKPAFAGFVAVFVMLGIFGYGQIKNSLPGDVLYAIRKAAHEGEVVFVSENEKPAFQLKLANDRLEDLSKASAKNLAPTLDEFQANMSEAARNLAGFDASSSDPMAIKKIVAETKKLEENKQKIESMGVVFDNKSTAEFNSALAKVVENLIQDLEVRTLTEEKAETVSQMKELFEQEKYSDALELYLTKQ